VSTLSPHCPNDQTLLARTKFPSDDARRQRHCRHLRYPKLPSLETADELCDVAHDLGVDPATHL